MKAAQIVGAHDPDENALRATADQITHGLVGIMRTKLGFEIGDVDAGIVGQRFCRNDAGRERREAEAILQRVAPA